MFTVCRATYKLSQLVPWTCGQTSKEHRSKCPHWSPDQSANPFGEWIPSHSCPLVHSPTRHLQTTETHLPPQTVNTARFYTYPLLWLWKRICFHYILTLIEQWRYIFSKNLSFWSNVSNEKICKHTKFWVLEERIWKFHDQFSSTSNESIEIRHRNDFYKNCMFPSVASKKCKQIERKWFE